ncbi:hypothetical protein [Methanocella conradii]|uniref:hypothetical protein n=1 Tax=Methanocella conradii TaxID=1175444 RepID=UPI00157DE337|nr:hypothetical protein [Methanocella conradii]
MQRGLIPCRQPTEDQLTNITLGIYGVRMVRVARNIFTGRYASIRNPDVLSNPEDYVRLSYGQIYNRRNGRIVANNICLYVQITHAKHIAYDAQRYPNNRSIRGEVNIRGYVRIDQVDYGTPSQPILKREVEDKLNKIMLDKFFTETDAGWLDGIIEWEVTGTEVSSRYWVQYEDTWTLEAWYSHGQITPSFGSAEYRVHRLVVIAENELY